jgi:cardiolipin synthase
MLKKLRKLAFSRVFVVGIFIILQFFLIFSAALQFTKYFVVYYALSLALTFVFVLRIINTNQRMAYKLAWIVVIFIFPAFGGALYLIFCGNRLSPRSRGKMQFISDATKISLECGECVIEEMALESRTAAKQSRYIQTAGLCPPYKNTSTRYFPTGEAMIDTLIEKLETAKKYIFLEYFIIEDGEMWGRIHAVLKRKVAEGVDVRVIYDDIGCILTVDRNFAARLEAEGIKCRVFHRFVPVLSSRQNNRDHRKICVVDGICAFTGGINIADEYINKVERFGYWKDNAVMLEGEAVWSFTVMFLGMWDYLIGKKKVGDYLEYKPDYAACAHEADLGYVQPYTDSPLDDEALGENIYLGMIEAAQNYVWITTPYLIIDEQMTEALCRAVKSGVDVRIVTPGIPDKKLVNETTKSYYPILIENGVKIYEYKPGFIHAKTFLCDDRLATVGSVNLDYRSLYLHFECGVWLYNAECIADIKKDFFEIFDVSEQIRKSKNSLFRQLFHGVLELIAPLL